MRCPNLLLALPLALTTTVGVEAAPASPVTRFPTADQCVAKGHFSDEDCQQAFDAALRLYSDRVPTFPSRELCNKVYRTCIVYLPYPAPARLDPKKLRYAPPFLGIAKTDASPDLHAISILIGMEQIGMKAQVARKLVPPKPATGHFELPRSVIAKANAPRQTPADDDIVIIDGAMFSEPLPGQVLTYPVPKHMLPKKLPSLR